MSDPPRIAAILPCYRSSAQVLGVIDAIGARADIVICVDDACPDGTGALVEANRPHAIVLRHAENQGVGGAVCTGYAHALALGCDILVKIDSDGQMDPAELPALIGPIARGQADYTKGNRFFNLEDLRGMPFWRVVGNAGLSFLTKLSTGYWSIFDPTNGYTALHARVAERLPLHKLARGYFFESDLLFRLGTLRARVVDVPMAARYGEETSSLRIGGVVGPFLARNLANFLKRLFYSYVLRNFSVASIYVALGTVLTVFGVAAGAEAWIAGTVEGVPATSGQVMLAALPIILGMQMLLSFVAYDVASEPATAIHPLLLPRRPPSP
jgi:glycosyltransferase involved in cell wall biosynthesis